MSLSLWDLFFQRGQTSNKDEWLQERYSLVCWGQIHEENRVLGILLEPEAWVDGSLTM